MRNAKRAAAGRLRPLTMPPEMVEPEREKQVLQNVETWSEGPLEPIAIRRLFERIIDESRRVEREVAQEELSS